MENAEQKNTSQNLLATKLKNKSTRLLLQIPSLIVVLFFVMIFVLPVVKIRIFETIDIKLLELDDYDIDKIIPGIYAILILFTAIGIDIYISLIKKDKTTIAIVLSFIFAAAALVFTVLLSLRFNDIVLTLQKKGAVAERGLAATLMIVGGYISAIYNLLFGTIVILIHMGKIKLKANDKA